MSTVQVKGSWDIQPTKIVVREFSDTSYHKMESCIQAVVDDISNKKYETIVGDIFQYRLKQIKGINNPTQTIVILLVFDLECTYERYP